MACVSVAIAQRGEEGQSATYRQFFLLSWGLRGGKGYMAAAMRTAHKGCWSVLVYGSPFILPNSDACFGYFMIFSKNDYEIPLSNECSIQSSISLFEPRKAFFSYHKVGAFISFLIYRGLSNSFFGFR